MTSSEHPTSYWLAIAGALTLIVAAIHFGCIVFGADWYRFLGAGEQMAQLAEQGHWYPTVVTGVLVLVFLLWSAYAFSGAGLIRRLPLLRFGLCLIALLLLARALGAYFLLPLFPGNSLTFWIVSSSVCLALGGTYAAGITQSWNRLRK